MKNNSKNVLIILTGSIACYKACSIISKLKQLGYNLKVILSPSSLEFIGRATIEGLTGESPITDMYTSGNVMDHISLARWADLILVAPATANYINKIAHGLGDDLLTTLFLAHDFTKPFLIAPAMNTKMYLHPTTQNSINKLKQMKVEILETASGVLACGEIGSGKLLEPDLIVEEVEKHFGNTTPAHANKHNPEPNKKLKVLITSGGTTEPIDDIRVITNKSTGKTAATIADALIESGLDVTYLHSQTAIKTQNGCKNISFESFNDLKNILFKELEQTKYAYVIHAAAVSDYSVLPLLGEQAGKINSDQEELTLTLKKNPKLINEIKKISPQSHLLAFKLTSTADENLITKKINSLFELAKCDLVIQNDWSDIKNKNYKYQVFNKTKNSKKINDLQSLCAAIFQEITANENKQAETL
ncbi:MAG: bifunctional phosphopantothenoylcysteine decarboxylase/phosphopantothenate--cysteine ligase CoaBC [Bdellovibrionota bacterium]